MKKISLKDLSSESILSREELKAIKGGELDRCIDGSDCPSGYVCMPFDSSSYCIPGGDDGGCSATATCGSYPSVTCNGTYDCVKTNGVLVACTHAGGTTVVKCPGVV